MERDVAVRIDAMLMASRGGMDGLAHYLKNNTSDEEYREYIYSIGEAMAALLTISVSLHKKFPDIVPKELTPEKK